ncbi:MAG: type II toxin-antitoxin system death-on-curing family toxin [Oscillospiraceae bacterium]|jgi:death-on-curing protein|nr:type II toxin-antitoxin system death-on-curing family toxin [Oscillospiraceae bacterium]
MKIISKKQALLIHRELIDRHGGSDGVRDIGLLESALAAPFQSAGGELFYPSLQQQAARLGFGIVQNHPFFDGNKRTGAHLMLIFLALNGIELEYTQKELVEVILNVASGTGSCDTLLRWIISHEK